MLRVVEIEPVTVAFSARVLYRIKKGAKSFLLLVAFFPYDPFPLHLDSLRTHTFCTKLITVAGYPPDPPYTCRLPRIHPYIALFVYLRWNTLGDPFCFTLDKPQEIVCRRYPGRTILSSTSPKRSLVDIISSAATISFYFAESRAPRSPRSCYPSAKNADPICPRGILTMTCSR